MNLWRGRFWEWLLYAYPAEFRCEYGPEMMEALRERWREEGDTPTRRNGRESTLAEGESLWHETGAVLH